MIEQTTTQLKVNRQHPLAIKIRKQITQALSDYKMIADGDKVMVCVSGGKDSSILTILLDEIRKRAEIEFTIEAVILDQKQPGFEVTLFKNWMLGEDIKFNIIQKDTYSVVKEKVTTGVYCSLCSKMRRAILYDYAFNHGFKKLALGHHRTDLIETTLLNMFYTGHIATMPAKLKSDDGRNIVIRPMMYVAEDDLINLAKDWGFPIIPCNLCGSQDGMKRQRMKKLIKDLETEIPSLSSSFITALQNVNPSHTLDKKLFDFENM